jgi:hypothetical protein
MPRILSPFAVVAIFAVATRSVFLIFRRIRPSMLVGRREIQIHQLRAIQLTAAATENAVQHPADPGDHVHAILLSTETYRYSSTFYGGSSFQRCRYISTLETLKWPGFLRSLFEIFEISGLFGVLTTETLKWRGFLG